MGSFSKVDYPSYGKADNHTDDWEAPIEDVGTHTDCKVEEPEKKEEL